MLKVGIIGGGFGAGCLRAAFTGIPGCKVVGVCESRAGWRSFIVREDLDAVVIAVPPRAQYTIAKAAMRKGLHVFAEKPLAANVRQAKELFVLAKKKRIVHAVDFMFPEIAAWKKAKVILNSGKLGKLNKIRVDWDWLSNDIRLKQWSWRTKRREGGGALSFYFSHGLYYLEQFAGPIESGSISYEYAKENPNDGEAGFKLLLRFKNGAAGRVHVSSNSPKLVRHCIEFRCEKGALVLENKNAIVDHFILATRIGGIHRRVPVHKDKGREGEDERVKIVKILARRFVSACARSSPMRPSFADGVRVQELIERIRKSGQRETRGL